MTGRYLIYVLVVVGFVGLGPIACSGSDSPSATANETPPAAANTPPLADADAAGVPFGLTERAPLADFSLPNASASVSSYTAESAYPNLAFNAALAASDVPGEQRIVFAEQGGMVKVFQDSADVAESRVLLDLSNRVKFGGEEGLLGLALDPNFTQNRYVYLYYSPLDPLSTILSRFTWDATTDTISQASEKVILQIPQPFANHNGGGIVFGPDGFLYLGSGDGGNGGDPQGNGQNLNTLLGKVLRIDVNPANPADAYAIPTDNPFANTPNTRPEIYAYGLRNPFRFSFDRQTGELWLGDVGQADFEEVNKIVAGGNYGWRFYEGNSIKNELPANLSADDFIAPLHVYDHSQGISVMGGYVYRGTAIPSLVGKYIYGDFNGQVWALTLNGDQVVANDPIAKLADVTGFFESNEGELLIITRYAGLYRLTANTVANSIPTRLSETGLFADLASLTPAAGLIPYKPNHSFWSDATSKTRWAGIPQERKIAFSADDWALPPGSVTLKHFDYNQVQGDPGTTRRLETRVMLNSDQGWRGFTYRWNDEQTDATLVTARETTTLSITQADGSVKTQQYDFPSENDCFRCHTEAEGRTLGLNTAQLNGEFDYGVAVDNQIRSWNHIGLFDSDVGDPSQYSALAAKDDESASIVDRARAYLDVNCSSCHQPGGTAPVTIDLRAVTAADAMNVINVTPTTGSLGIAGALILAPGAKEKSVLWQRLNVTKLVSKERLLVAIRYAWRSL